MQNKSPFTSNISISSLVANSTWMQESEGKPPIRDFIRLMIESPDQAKRLISEREFSDSVILWRDGHIQNMISLLDVAVMQRNWDFAQWLSTTYNFLHSIEKTICLRKIPLSDVPPMDSTLTEEQEKQLFSAAFSHDRLDVVPRFLGTRDFAHKWALMVSTSGSGVQFLEKSQDQARMWLDWLMEPVEMGADEIDRMIVCASKSYEFFWNLLDDVRFSETHLIPLLKAIKFRLNDGEKTSPYWRLFVDGGQKDSWFFHPNVVNHPSLMDYLIKEGANPNESRHGYITPIHYWILKWEDSFFDQYGQAYRPAKSIIRGLTEWGGRLEGHKSGNKSIPPAIHVAAQMPDAVAQEAIPFLISLGADKNEASDGSLIFSQSGYRFVAYENKPNASPAHHPALEKLREVDALLASTLPLRNAEKNGINGPESKIVEVKKRLI